jgi:hypothetical protein
MSRGGRGETATHGGFRAATCRRPASAERGIQACPRDISRRPTGVDSFLRLLQPPGSRRAVCVGGTKRKANYCVYRATTVCGGADAILSCHSRNTGPVACSSCRRAKRWRSEGWWSERICSGAAPEKAGTGKKIRARPTSEAAGPSQEICARPTVSKDEMIGALLHAYRTYARVSCPTTPGGRPQYGRLPAPLPHGGAFFFN